MESFKYVDIFSTKGVEYIIVLAFLGILIVFWKWMSKYGYVNTAKQKIKQGVSLIDWFHLKNDYFYHQGHSWASVLENEVVKVGVDDFAQKFLGKPSKISLPGIGSTVRQGESGITFKIDSQTIDILSPVEGKVVEINKEVVENPELINKAPYSDGWLFKVKSLKVKSNLKNLITGKVALAWMEDTAEKISNVMTKDVGIVMQDGGVPVSGFAKEISRDNWTELAKEFLLTKDK